METDEAIYRAFLLRLWQVEQNGTVTWRCSLEEAVSGQRLSFASLVEMLGYLQAETSAPQSVAQNKEETS